MRKYQLIKYIAGLALIITGCASNAGNKTDVPIKVEVEQVKADDGSQMFAYSGTIEETETVPHSFLSVGSVSRVFVSEGARVRRGELLATLDDATYRNTYEMIHATELQAEDAYQRLTVLHKNGNLPDVKYVEVQTGLAQAKASAAIAKKNLEGCMLFAATDGFVGKRSIEPGMTAMPNIASLTIVKINRVYARVAVGEDEISLLKKGDTAAVTIGALGSSRYTGLVEEIGVVADPIVHTYKVKIGIENGGYKIKPGMICTVRIECKNVNRGMIVPSRAVMLDEEDRNFVYTVSPQYQAVKRYVTVGSLLNGGIEIREGVQIGERIVVTGQHKLVENAAVQIINE